MKTFCTAQLFSLLMLLCISQKSNAQNGTLRFEHLGFKEGLSGDNVTAILQDNKGYIWFGTMSGLNKYDGYSFTKYRFDPFDPNSLSQNFIYTIFEDRTGAIWVSTFEGLCRFERSTEKFTRYRPSSNAKFSDPNISAINEDANGMIWVGNHSGGLCRFDPQTGKFLPDSFDLGFRRLGGDKEELHGGINCIYKDTAGTLWVGNHVGNGIPQNNIDKIFQPFFTTKTTGQGIGLGLLLAYDIVAKEHGGQLKVETQEGDGAEFLIQSPGS